MEDLLTGAIEKRTGTWHCVPLSLIFTPKNDNTNYVISTNGKALNHTFLNSYLRDYLTQIARQML